MREELNFILITSQKIFTGVSKIEKVIIENDKKEIKELKVDSVLAFFGLKNGTWSNS